jgi:hypothetical protein
MVSIPSNQRLDGIDTAKRTRLAQRNVKTLDASHDEYDFYRLGF